MYFVKIYAFSGGVVEMARDNTRKIKLLKILDFLRKDTDEQHPMTTNQLCAALAEIGISCDRRTLSQDIATLNEAGYEIMSTMKKAIIYPTVGSAFRS